MLVVLRLQQRMKPWHVGDESTFVVARNTGTKQGNVSLKMESSAGSYQGSMVTLGQMKLEKSPLQSQY